MAIGDNGFRLSNFIKYHRGKLNLTQGALAQRAGVGLRFVRDLEQGKQSLRMDKINQVLHLFGYTLVPGSARMTDPYRILLEDFNSLVRVKLMNGADLTGYFVDTLTRNNEIRVFLFAEQHWWKEYRKTGNRKILRTLEYDEIASVEKITS